MVLSNRFLSRIVRTAAGTILLLGALSAPTALAAPASSGPPGNLLGPPSDDRDWQFLVQAGAAATITQEDQDVLISVRSPGANAWSVQLQAFPVLQEGQEYTLQFRAKADPPRDLNIVGALNQPDYHKIGLLQTVPAATDWKRYTMTFVAQTLVPGHNCAPQFQVGDHEGKVWLADISLIPTPAAASLMPQVGEVRLEGTLRDMDATRRRLTLLAIRAQDPGQDPRGLDPPRQKVVLVRPSTTLRPAGGGPAALSAFQPGDTVIVIGKSEGTGRPLVARVVAATPSAAQP